MAASENLRNVVAQKNFSLHLKLYLYHNHFRSYSFAAGMTKMSSNISFNVLLKNTTERNA